MQPYFLKSIFDRSAAHDWWTCNAAVDRKSFFEIGGFDPGFLGLGGSDSDFAMRHAHKYNAICYVDNTARHRGITSGKLEKSPYSREKYHERRGNGWYEQEENWVLRNVFNF